LPALRRAGAEDPSGPSLTEAPDMETKLIENTKPAEHDCNWCGAKVGDIHAPACPMGERYRQIQDMGGAPWK